MSSFIAKPKYKILLMLCWIAFLFTGCCRLSPSTIDVIETDIGDIEKTVLQSELEQMNKNSKTLDEGLRIKK